MADSQKPNRGAQPGPPRLVLSRELKPVYANLVRIAHSPSELVFDFARLLPGERHAPIEARVLMSPLSAKLFLRALSENLAKYEASYGEIEIPSKKTLADHLFGPLQPPDSPEDSDSPPEE